MPTPLSKAETRVLEVRDSLRALRLQVPQQIADEVERRVEAAFQAFSSLLGHPYVCLACAQCGQNDFGQTGERPCPKCGLPMIWDSVPERMSAGQYAQMQADFSPVEVRAVPSPTAGPIAQFDGDSAVVIKVVKGDVPINVHTAPLDEQGGE